MLIGPKSFTLRSQSLVIATQTIVNKNKVIDFY